MFVLTTVWAITIADIFQYERANMAFVVLAWASFVAIVTLDAAHPSSANLAVYAVFFGIVCQALFMIFLQFEMFPSMRARTVDAAQYLGVGSKGKALQFNTVLFANQRMLIMILFFVRTHLVASVLSKIIPA